ncbi:MAG: saccharopine dehydrogenase NADP-binding domain-containing protein [Pseudomonadota bacterium]
MSESVTTQPTTTPREIDILVFGATGFTGQIVAEYMQRQYGQSNLTWALGGRNEAKLQRVAEQVKTADGRVPAIYVADSQSPEQLADLVSRARVVLTTVGPYAKFGSNLVAACAASGTHYCDLTGEVQWMQQMITQHSQAAINSGARIVHTCGFDSIPSDIGAYRLVKEMEHRHGCAPAAIKYRMRNASGGLSGGTFDSLITMMEQADADPSIKAIVADPYGLNPPDSREGLDGPDKITPEWDADFGGWVGPFVMAQINTRVVRRSNALMNYRYGMNFRYDEATLMPWGAWGGLAAAGLSLGTATINAMAGFGPTRSFLKSVGPKAGTGPSTAQQERGFFDIELLAKHPDDSAKDIRLKVWGDRDPGYGSTAKMLSECAVCLAQDELTCSGGFWTPASAMGDQLLERLPANAGVTFEIIS